MAKFLTTLETSAKIEKVIRQAEEELILITLYLKLTQIFQDRLIDAGNRNVNIKLIYGGLRKFKRIRKSRTLFL